MFFVFQLAFLPINTVKSIKPTITVSKGCPAMTPKVVAIADEVI